MISIHSKQSGKKGFGKCGKWPFKVGYQGKRKNTAKAKNQYVHHIIKKDGKKLMNRTKKKTTNRAKVKLEKKKRKGGQTFPVT